MELMIHDPYVDQIVVDILDYICSWVEWVEKKIYGVPKED